MRDASGEVRTCGDGQEEREEAEAARRDRGLGGWRVGFWVRKDAHSRGMASKLSAATQELASVACAWWILSVLTPRERQVPVTGDDTSASRQDEGNGGDGDDTEDTDLGRVGRRVLDD
jgi:hypothetical protein